MVSLSALLLLSALLGSAPIAPAAPRPAQSPAVPADPLARIAELRTRAQSARTAGDPAGARAAVSEALELCIASVDPLRTAELERVLVDLASDAYALGDQPAALRGFAVLVERRAARLAPEDPGLLLARSNLATMQFVTGDLPAAAAGLSSVLAVLERTRPADDPDVTRARTNLAGVLKGAGKTAEARALFEQALSARERTLPADHFDLAAARSNLASLLVMQGEFERAQVLLELAITTFSRLLPAAQTGLTTAQSNLAELLLQLGDLERARSVAEFVLAVRERELPADHPELAGTRMQLGWILHRLGDLPAARALVERVVATRTRTFPPDHPDLLAALANLASISMDQGDVAAARTVFERVRAAYEASRDADDPNLARVLLELAAALRRQGEFEQAEELARLALVSLANALPAGHPDITSARVRLADIMLARGQASEARALLEQALEERLRTSPAGDPRVINTHGCLATAIAAEAFALRATDADPEADARLQGEFVEQTAAFVLAQRARVRATIPDASPREAEERIAHGRDALSRALSFAAGAGVFHGDAGLEEAAWLLSAESRSSAIATARIARAAHGNPAHAALQAELRRASTELARAARSGATSAELDAARLAVDNAGRDLVRAASRLPGASTLEPTDVRSFARRLAPGQALVAWRRYAAIRIDAHGAAEDSGADRFTAHVLARPVGSEPGAEPMLVRVDLGLASAIETATDRWREVLGRPTERGLAATDDREALLRTRGAELRALILDPLAAALAGTDRVVVVLDDVLHAVPLDALPLGGPFAADDAHELCGDRYRFEVRDSELELLVDEPALVGEPRLLAIGHPAFDSAPADPEEESAVGREPAAATRGTPTDARGARAWDRAFTTLPATRGEVRAVAEYFAEAFDTEGAATGGRAHVLERKQASRENFLAQAPSARWLHVATHGWFAPESVRSFADAPTDRASASDALDSETRVRGTSPMVLCGLALSGANLPMDAAGRQPGLVTAQEIAALDLSGCELAVLSACDTNVGVRRAGQGVASLQRALRMAGARSTITSLWQVPDEATRELMTDFYRRLWIEHAPKSEALWAAKKRLREARDEDGRPKYEPRDWAGWILCGDPR